jgi:hypothetical protein
VPAATRAVIHERNEDREAREAPTGRGRCRWLLVADAGHAVRPPVSGERRGCSGDDGGRHDALAEELAEPRAVPDVVGLLLRHSGVVAVWAGAKRGVPSELSRFVATALTMSEMFFTLQDAGS